MNHLDLLDARSLAETRKHLAAAHLADAYVAGAPGPWMAFCAENYRKAATAFDAADRAVEAERAAFLGSITPGATATDAEYAVGAQ